jgi:NADPH-dependent glutamate synthase beta subunit-like oxidoreductase
MNELLKDGIDFIGLARPWLSEPDFANRVKAGDHRPSRCVSREHICNMCLTRLALGPVTCYKFFPGYCKMECPIDQNSPEYIDHIANKKFEEAYKTVVKDNPFPESICRVCSRPCEDVCMGKKGEGLAIRDLKRFAVEYGKKNSLDRAYAPVLKDDKSKIAIIGSGPAGLACASELARKGYSPTVFEKNEKAGGAMRIIPKFRLPEDALDSDIKRIEDEGVEIITKIQIGKDIPFSDIMNDYDAVFMATGTKAPSTSPIPGADKKQVISAFDFLTKVSRGESTDLGDRVAVIGGGSVAIDSAMTALRLGAKSVTTISLEERDDMPAYDWEIEEATDEGIEILNSWGVIAVEGQDNVSGIKLIKCTSVFDEDNRFSPSYDNNQTKNLDVDTVILAIGQSTNFDLLADADKETLFENGKLIYDEVTFQTKTSKLFVGGDSAIGSKTVVESVKTGKNAAESIDRFLRKADLKRTPKEDYYEPFFIGATACGHNITIDNPEREIPPKNVDMNKRRSNFDEIQGTFTEEQAVKEARRCLKYDVDLEKESKERYASMGKAQIDFRHLDGTPL